MKISLAVILILLSVNLFSQDWAQVNPEMNKILVDTTLLRSTIAIIEPGMKSEIHTHPASFVYALTDGRLKVYYAEGKSEEIELKAGDFMYADPEKPHQTENTGNKTIKFLLIELKEHPYRVSGKN